MPSYRRDFALGGTFLFTVALLERKRDLLVRDIAWLRESVRHLKWVYPFRIGACVALPGDLQ